MRLTPEMCTFTIECTPEDAPVRGNAMASGDDALDKEVEDQIIADLEWNEWAWCVVKVTCRYGRASGAQYLGGCSYKDESDFSSPDGYLPQMKAEAYEECCFDVESIKQSLEGIET